MINKMTNTLDLNKQELQDLRMAVRRHINHDTELRVEQQRSARLERILDVLEYGDTLRITNKR